jgi:myosin heavy subunit
MNTSDSKIADRHDGGRFPQRVYIKDDVEGWVVGVVLESSKLEARCRLLNGEERIVKLKEYKKSELPRENNRVTKDLINMDYIHEPGVLFNLIRRCERGMPYTRAGDILVSVNPFHWTDGLYSKSSQKFYAQKLIWDVTGEDPRRGLEPHLYEVSATAYLGLAFQGQNQSILITGESGSGKTEAAKLMMCHIATIQLGPTNADLSDREPTSPDLPGTSDVFSEIVKRILITNPILEAFGNAATSQNDNSSRFGKYTQLQFKNGDSTLETYNIRSNATCSLVGSVCDAYLLEASRICTHALDERNYHIFYQLLSTDDEMKSLIWAGLVGRTATDFKYVGVPSTEEIGGVHDAVKFQETWSALGRLGIAESKILMLMRAICLVMQLGNLEFTVDPACDDKALVKEATVAFVSDLLGVSKEDLLLSFTERTMKTRGEVFKVPLSLVAASDARDAFAKEIYNRSFFWLVDAMNSKTRAETNLIDCQPDYPYGIIGILDIFGFESFKTNRFEQLCINYANEKLHQKAINDIFVAVREEYMYEGIQLDLVDFTSNKQILDFIEGRTGLIALLNEESYRPKGSSKAFTMKVFENYGSLPHLIKPSAGVTNQFGIAHFAGSVMYTTDNFLISNQDTLPHDLKDCLSKSTNFIVSGSLLIASVNRKPIRSNAELPTTKRAISKPIFENKNSLPDISRKLSTCKPMLNEKQAEKPNFDVTVKPKMQASQQVILNRDSYIPNKEHQMCKKMDSDIVAPTMGTKYRSQLSLLLTKLSYTYSRYVRCIKPNRNKNPSEWSRCLMYEQIRCAGIVPAVILSRALFAKSISNKVLTVKYRILWNKAMFPSKVKRMDKKETRLRIEAESILASIFTLSGKIPSDTLHPIYFVGKTKTYFRHGAFEHVEKMHLDVVQICATTIQRCVRGKAERKNIQQRIKHQKQYNASLQIQKTFRMHIKRICSKNLQNLKNTKACVIQQRFRGFITRKRYIYFIFCAKNIQLWWRRASEAKKDRNAAVVKIQCIYRSKRFQRINNIRTYAVYKIQVWIRKILALKARKFSMAVKIQKKIRSFLIRPSIIEMKERNFRASVIITNFFKVHHAFFKFRRDLKAFGYKAKIFLVKI